MFLGSGAPMLQDFAADPAQQQPSNSGAAPVPMQLQGGPEPLPPGVMDPRMIPTPIIQAAPPPQQAQPLPIPLMPTPMAAPAVANPGLAFPNVQAAAQSHVATILTAPSPPRPQPGGIQNGMINLADLQPAPAPPPPPPGTNAMPTPQGILALAQGIDSLPATLQQDPSFIQAVQARQVAQAAVEALRVVKMLIAKEGLAGLQVNNEGQGMRQVDGDTLFVNQRVVVQDGRKMNQRGGGHDGVVLHPGGQDGLVLVKLLQTGEQARVPRRQVIPAAGDGGVLGHDLMDPDFLGDVDDILGGDVDILDPAVMGGAAHPQASNQAPGVSLGAMPAVLDQPFGAGLQMPPAKQQAAKVAAAPPPGISAEAKAALVSRVRKDLLELEDRVPWVLARLAWQKERQRWRQALEGCQAAEDLVPLLAAFCAALHRAAPGKGGAGNKAGGGAGSRSGGASGGMQLLVDALGTEVAAGREAHRMLDARWDEARSDIESWLETQGLDRLAGLSDLVGKAAVALERAAKGGDDALLQVPLEAMLGNNVAAMSLLKDVLERERGSALLVPISGKSNEGDADSGGSVPEVTFAEVLGPGGILGKRRQPEPESSAMDAEDYGDTTDVDDMDINGPS